MLDGKQQTFCSHSHSLLAQCSVPILTLEFGFNAACTPAPGGVSKRIGLRGSRPASRCHLAISCMDQVPDEDEIILLVSQVVYQCIPGTMNDAFPHALLCKDCCRMFNSFRQIEDDRAEFRVTAAEHH